MFNKVESDALFVVGNGEHSGARSNAFTVAKSGNSNFTGNVSATGFILTAPNGSKFMLKVNNTGELIAEGIGTEGLVYTLIDGGYSVSGYTGTDANVIVPAYYNGLPVIDLGKDVYGVFSLYNNPNQIDIQSIILPDTLLTINQMVFDTCSALNSLTIPASVKFIDQIALYMCNGPEEIIFKGTHEQLSDGAFGSNTGIAHIYVPWGEGEVAGAPWGASEADVHYNWREE